MSEKENAAKKNINIIKEALNKDKPPEEKEVKIPESPIIPDDPKTVQGNTSFFKLVFGNDQIQRSVFKSLHPDESVDSFKQIEINNESLLPPYNSVSFLAGNRLMILIEYQSDTNPNIPLSMLIHLTMEYQRILTDSNKWDRMLGNELVEIPVPEIFVIHTGHQREEVKELKLSDAFKGSVSLNALSFTVPIYSAGCKIRIVSEYCEMIQSVKNLIENGLNARSAILCVLKQYRASTYEISSVIQDENSIVDMMIKEFSWDDYVKRLVKVKVEEEIERGERKGEQGLIDLLIRLQAKGVQVNLNDLKDPVKLRMYREMA